MFHKLPSALIIVAFLLSFLPGKSQTANFSYGFEAAPAANDWSENIAVPSGTNSITAATGSFYGSVPSPAMPNQFTRFGGYNSVFPCEGFKTSIKIYLDVAGGWANDTRADYSVAINNTSGNHRRDFIFHIGYYDDATGLGANTNRFIIGGSNNAPGNPKSSGQFIINTTGWYTFEHNFKNVAGILTVDFTVFDESNALVGTFTRSNVTDLIPSVVGGNRYGWFVNNAFSVLAVDDINLTVSGPIVTNTNTLKTYCSIQAAIDDPLTLNGHTLVATAGTYAENITVNKNLTIQGPNVGVAGNGTRVAEAIISDGKVDILGSNTVVFDGFKIYQTNTTTPISLGGGAVATIQNNIIERFGVATGSTVRGLEISSGAGVKTIANNLFTGDLSGGLFGGHKTWNSGIYLNAASSTVNLTGNVFQNCRTALNIDDLNAGIALTANTFDNNGTHISIGGTSPTTGSYAFGANDYKVAGSGIINLSNVTAAFRLDISAGTFNGTAFSALPLADLFNIEAGMYHRTRDGRLGLVYYVPNNLYVRADINTNIETAYNYAAAGDIINVAAGNFNVTLNAINKAITIKGNNGGIPAAVGDGTIPGSRLAESVLSLNSGSFFINANDITLDGLHLKRGERAIRNENIAANNFSLINCLIENTDAAPNEMLQFYGTATREYWAIKNNRFTGIQGGTGAILFSDNGFNNILVEKNDFMGEGTSGIHGVASNLTIKGNYFASTNSAAINMNGLNNPTIEENIVHVNGFGLQLTTTSGGVVRNNTIIGTQARLIDGINYMRGIDIFGAAFSGPNSAGLLIENNQFQDFTAAVINPNDQYRGIHIRQGAKDITIKGNIFTNSHTSLGIVPTAPEVEGIVMTENDLSGTVLGLFNASSVSVDATCNWWGSVLPAIVASKISGPATFTPFLVNGTDDDPIAPGFQPVAGSCTGDYPVHVYSDLAETNLVAKYPTIQSAIDNVTTVDGYVVRAFAGTFVENVVVNKRLKIVGSGNTTIVQGVGGTGSIFTYQTPASGSNATEKASLESMKLTDGERGISASQLVNYLKIEDVTFEATSTYGIHINNISSTMLNWEISNSRFTNITGAGIQIGTAAGVNGFTIANTSFNNNSGGAIYSGQSSSTPGVLVNVSITGSTFTSNGHAANQSAIYLEKLSNAIISDNIFTNNGLNTNSRAVLVNLKYGNYTGINIAGNTIVENRGGTQINGYGINVQARNDAPSYNAIPATLTTLGISENEIDGFFRGIEVTNAVDWNTTTILNNKVDNCENGILGIISGAGNTANAGTTMQVHENSITNAALAVVNVNSNGGLINATCNWYGTADQSQLAALNVGNVTFLPYLLDGTDGNVAIGFQPTGICALTQLYVNDNNLTGDVYTTAVGNDANPGTPSAPFATIAHALSVAAPGNTIYVDAGEYPEVVTIGKSITLLGSNASTSPNVDGNPSSVNPSRAAESIIKSLTTSGATILSGANDLNVVIRGFTIDRGNGTANSARFMDLINRTGNVWTYENNIFQNAPSTINGYFYLTGTTTGMDFTFNQNRFTNNGNSNGLAFWGSNPTLVSITKNVWYNNAGWGMNANSIQGTISANSFVEDRINAADIPNWSNYQNGVLFANANNDIELKANLFSKVHIGLYLYRFGVGFGGTLNATQNIFNQAFQNAARVLAGDVVPDLTNVSFNNNALLNGSIIDATGQPIPLNATCNWYDSENPAIVATKILGNVTFLPYLVDGTDADPVAPGFQPLPGSCSGDFPTENYPDLSPTIIMPSNTFNPNEIKNALLFAAEVNNTSTATGVTSFGLTVPSGYEILAYDGMLTSMTPSGGVSTYVNNGEFEVISSSSTQIIFRAKAGVAISASGIKVLGVQVQRTTALAGSVSTMTVGILPDPTLQYDSNNQNNNFSRSLNAQ